MVRSVIKLTWRSVRSFLGRYMALLLIAALSVGFFAGLKITQKAMINTCEKFLTEHSFYDFRVISTLGFDEADIEELGKLEQVKAVEGSKSVELIAGTGSDSKAYRFISLPEEINTISLTAGNLPQTSSECIVDAEFFDKNCIGQKIVVSAENAQESAAMLSNSEFTIVGLADSPLYLSDDRGTTTIGSGSISGFVYLPEENFTIDVYTEAFLILNETAEIYSDEYDELIESNKDGISNACQNILQEQYDELLTAMNITPELAEEAGISAPEKYVLTRNENTGYLNFENDTAVVSGIADIFPVFFILIAMLVCITTMTRMVDEERTQIGTLKALGFSEKAITAKYLLYAGSAAFIGWAVGFFLGTWGLPQVFWYAYASIYDFAELDYLFSTPLALGTLSVALAGILASTWIFCRKELAENPAALIRPVPPKNGKRIILERITLLWNKFSFIQKVSLRNMFRYKRRLVMMLIGTGCCTALVLTAFGVRDSMINVGSQQFGGVQKYDIEAGFDSENAADIKSRLDEISDEYKTAYSARADVNAEKTMKSIKLIAFENNNCGEFWNLSDKEEKLNMPEKGEALVSAKIWDKLELSAGDTIEVSDADLRNFTVKVSGAFDNYVDNYIIVSPDTLSEAFDGCEFNTFFIRTDAAADELMKIDGITSISSTKAEKENVDSAVECLNYIIWLIVLFSGALAFIVTYNLTNINIAERSREIATVQVLGFYPKETESYILRENLILSVIAGVLGLPLGVLFHSTVMDMIAVEAMTFKVTISFISYILALVCTVIFAIVVNVAMKKRINGIHMAESLKTVE